ncbi:hypothetical protein BV96_04375 [Sphingomonas paucimobilis]|nr:hypothetical protein BV96_04375 [Sphingomonas paucimobilis]
MTQRRQEVEDWGNTLLALGERAYRMIRGLPHHRLAMIAVTVGAAVVVSPVWEPYLRALAKKHLAIDVDLPTDPIFGTALIAMGLGYHVLMTWIASRETIAAKTRDAQIEDRVRDHDAPIFTAFMAQAPENALKNAMSSIVNDHSYTSVQSTMLVGAYYFLGTTTNEFNDTDMRAKADTLKTQLDMLTDFVAHHFSPYGPVLAGDVLRFCMAPEWNIDRGGNPSHQDSLAYNDLTTRLTPMVAVTLAAYDDLVRTGHRRVL